MTETSEERRITMRPGAALATRNRPRGLWGQITTALLRPALFFRTLAPAGETRQWLWAGILVLALVGIAAVRYSSLDNAAPTDPGIVDPGFPPPMDMGGEFGGGIGVDGPGFGGVPPGGIPNDGGGGTAAPTESTLTADLTMALLAASNVVLGWIVLTIMLIVVPMLRGRAPKLGQNLQIAVWSSLPFAVMAVLQLLYWSGGGKLGEPGVQGLLGYLPEYETYDPTVQAALISLASRFTVFWLWSLVLVYFGARFALGGWRIVAFIVVLAWAVIQVGAPVVTGAITAAEPVVDDPSMVDPDFGGEFPGDMGGEMPPDGGEFPDDMGGEPPVDMGGDMPLGEDQPFPTDTGGEAEPDSAAEPPGLTAPDSTVEAEQPDAESTPVPRPGRP